MRAIEFVTNNVDGNIQIPREYLKDIGKEIRVIILVEDAIPKKPKKKKLTSFEITTKDIKNIA